MSFNIYKVGEQIASLRKNKNLTQAELGERLNVSSQAVSKWERGESMPEISLLPDLATALETTIDNILSDGTKLTSYGRKITVKEVKEALDYFEKIGELLGTDNAFYVGAIEGIDRKMNIEFENYMKDSFTREAMIAEAIIQCLICGAYVDLSDVKREIKHEHWYEIIKKFAKMHGIS